MDVDALLLKTRDAGHDALRLSRFAFTVVFLLFLVFTSAAIYLGTELDVAWPCVLVSSVAALFFGVAVAAAISWRRKVLLFSQLFFLG